MDLQTLALDKPALFVAFLVVLLSGCKWYFRGTSFKGPYSDLTGKFAIVTGGNSGIGMETVKMLSRKGCNVMIGGRDRKKSL